MRRLCVGMIAGLCVLVTRSFGAGILVPTAYVNAAQAMVAAANAQDRVIVGDFIDLQAMADKAVEGVDASASLTSRFERGFVGSSTLTDTVLGAIKQGGSYTLLHTVMKDGHPHAICRLLWKGGAMNYHDWTLDTRADGEIVAKDLYTATTGEEISATLHRLFVITAVEAEPGLMKRLFGSDKTFLDHSGDFLAINAATQATHWAEVKRIYDTLPVSMQDEKVIQVQRVMALEHLQAEAGGPAEFEAAVEKYQTLFAGDPSVDLICLDGWLQKKEYDQIFAGLERLDTWAGGDAYLEFLHGGLVTREGKPGSSVEAEKWLRKSIAEEPDFLKSRYALVDNQVAQRKYAEAVAALKAVEELTGKRLNLETVPTFAEFVESDAYQKYRAAAGN